MTVFEDGYMKGTCLLPVGGDHITKDISIVLRTTTEDAEKVKLKHGHAFYDHASVDEVFELPIIGTNQKQQFTQLELAEIIEARVAEIFDFVQDELRKMGVDYLPGGM